MLIDYRCGGHGRTDDLGWSLHRQAHTLRGEGKTVLFAYEPEIGFCVGDVREGGCGAHATTCSRPALRGCGALVDVPPQVVKDKDGISAAAVFAEMAQHVAQQGKTLQEHFWDLKDTYGHFVNKNSYLICHEQATLDKIFGRLRNDGHYWLRLGRFRVTGVRDLTVGIDTATEDGVPHLPVSASSHYLTYTFDNGYAAHARACGGSCGHVRHLTCGVWICSAVLTFRTSGTEPKLKYYSELHGFDPEATKYVAAVCARNATAAAVCDAALPCGRAELLELVELAVEHMLQPEVNGLAFPKEE